MPNRKLDPSVKLSKVMAVRLTERNHALIYFACRRQGIKISDYVNQMIKDHIKVRLPKKATPKKRR